MDRKNSPKITQRNISDVDKKDTRGKEIFEGSASPELISQEDIDTPIRQDVFFKPYDGKFLKIKNSKGYKYGIILGAAGQELIPVPKLKEVTDPYPIQTRKDFTSVLLTDPVAAPAAAFRVGTIFEDGFELQLTLASQFNKITGREMTPEEIQLIISTEIQNYSKFLEQLNTWKSDKDVEQLAKDLEGVLLAQGKAAGQIFPGILDLKTNQLPTICEIIPADDLGNPIIDIGETRKIVAVKITIDEKDKEENKKDILRADEIVYITRGMRGLRREAKYQGTSPLEPVLQISKALKRYYHLDAPLAMITSYMTKQLLKVKPDMTDEATATKINTFMSTLFKSTTMALAMPEWFDDVKTIEPKVNWDMFNGAENKLANVELAVLQVPKSSQNREQDLNRDIATIQAIQFVRFVRKPDEKLIAKALETQIFDPLFAHLVGKNLKEIPVRIKIVRKQPEGGDIDKIIGFGDNLANQKSNDITSGNLMQNQSKTDTTKQ